MKKKIIGIFIFTLLIISVIPVVSSIDKNIEEKDATYFTSDEIFIDEDCGCNENKEIRHGFGIMEERSEPLPPDETSVKPNVLDTPDYFNWMDFEDQDWTTNAKNQGNCGSCWAFAALGSLESIINIREGRADLDLDLSEQYALSCLPSSGSCIGGWSWRTFHYIMSNLSSGNFCNGIIPENCFPYRDVDKNGFNGYNYYEPVLCDEKCENWESFLIPISDYGHWNPSGSNQSREEIKTQIMEDGPVVTHMMVTYYIHGKDNFVEWGFEHHDPDEYYSSSQQFGTINHVVVLVGWKDDPSIDNGGYWICKNSWGQDWGYNGFFNIEYGCLRIDDFEIVWADYDPEEYINWQPVADAGGIYYGDVEEQIIFDGSNSFDHEGEIISYEWSFGDGYNDSGITSPHIYESQNVYTVTLTVTDNEGNTRNYTTWAFIGRSNDPPDSPAIKGPKKGKNETDYDYTFSALDPEGDDVYYYIYWGDMEDMEPLEIWLGPYPSGDKITLNHTWFDEGNYTIRAIAKDCYGFKSDWVTREIKMPKYKVYIFNFPLLKWLFNRFPNAFPIFRYIVGVS